jgi:hypothetical protein
MIKLYQGRKSDRRFLIVVEWLEKYSVPFKIIKKKIKRRGYKKYVISLRKWIRRYYYTRV